MSLDTIYTDSNISFFNNRGGYFKDINAFIHVWDRSITIIDLANALQRGKTCTHYNIYLINQPSQNSSLTCELANVNKCKTFNDLYILVSDEQHDFSTENLNISKTEEKSINTFSPFVSMKPIKTPKKWTIAHVWKAILSGQIYKGIKDGTYTDDYAGDASCNFGTGRKLDLMTFAKELIEQADGWWISATPLENGEISLSVNCYSFDSNTLYFDVNCNREEAEQRDKQDENNIEEHNKIELVKVQEVKAEQLDNTKAYTVTFLDMNENTKMYEEKTEVLPVYRIFDSEDNYCFYKIIFITEFCPVQNEFYEISNTFARLKDDSDNRIINTGLYIHYVSGLALSEMLAEHKYIPTIVDKPISYDTLSDQLHAHYEPIQRNGVTITMRSGLFSHEQIDYRQEHNKLIKEYMRIPQMRNKEQDNTIAVSM